MQKKKNGVTGGKEMRLKRIKKKKGENEWIIAKLGWLMLKLNKSNNKQNKESKNKKKRERKIWKLMIENDNFF